MSIVAKDISDKVPITYMLIGRTKTKHLYIDPDVIIDNDKYISDEPIQYLPFKRKNQNSRILVFGASGSGKSTKVSELLDFMVEQKKTVKSVDEKGKVSTQEEFPSVLYFSSGADDDAYLNIKNFHRFPYDATIPEMVEDGIIKEDGSINLEIFANKILVFDDYLEGAGDALRIVLTELVKSALALGRKYQIDVLVVSHNPQPMTGRSLAQSISAECNVMIGFPATNKKRVSNFLDSWSGEDKKTISEMVKIQDNGAYTWLAYSRDIPRFYMTSRTIKLI